MITSYKFVNLVVVQSSYTTTKSSKVKWRDGDAVGHLTVFVRAIRHWKTSSDESEVVEGRVVIHELEEEQLDNHGVLV